MKLLGARSGGGLDALVLTHEHEDHCRGAERLRQAAQGCRSTPPPGTLDGAPAAGRDDRGRPVVIRVGRAVRGRAGFVIEPSRCRTTRASRSAWWSRTPAAAGSAWSPTSAAAASLAWGRLRDLDVLILETNHDLDMLRNGPYPWTLKQRVAGRHGHLSNREAAEGLPELLGDRLRWVVLYHLSRTNNLPALAAAAVGEVLDRERCAAQRLAVTEQDQPTPWLEVTL